MILRVPGARVAPQTMNSAFNASRGCAAIVVGLACAAPALAAEYKAIGNDPAILYDAPTLRGTRTFVAPRGMPVEVIVAQGDWARIRDASGGLAWVEKKMLVDRRTVVVNASAGATAHANAEEASPAVFRAQTGVLLDMVAPPSGGWVQVRHRDGQAGFVKVGEVWGE